MSQSKVNDIYDEVPEVNCKGICGATCCGPVLCSDAERELILLYRPELPKNIFTQQWATEILGNSPHTSCLTCPLLTKDGRCSIYPIRPLVCRLYGAVQEMRCPHGCTPKQWFPDRKARKLIRRLEELK